MSAAATVSARAFAKAPLHARAFSNQQFVSLVNAQHPNLARPLVPFRDHFVANRSFTQLVKQWSDARGFATAAAPRPLDLAKHEVVPEAKFAQCPSAALLEKWW
jgi:hypothetical protein